MPQAVTSASADDFPVPDVPVTRTFVITATVPSHPPRSLVTMSPSHHRVRADREQIAEEAHFFIRMSAIRAVYAEDSSLRP